jgi:hypothetical protein
MNPIMYEMFIGKIDPELWVFMGIIVLGFFGITTIGLAIEAIIKAVKNRK